MSPMEKMFGVFAIGYFYNTLPIPQPAKLIGDVIFMVIELGILLGRI